MVLIPRKKSESKQRGAYDLHLEHEYLLARCPEIFQLMSLPQVEGAPREPSAIRLFVQDGRLKAAVNDPSSEMVWFVTLDGRMDPLEAIERSLAEGTSEWREAKPMKGKRF